MCRESSREQDSLSTTDNSELQAKVPSKSL